MQLAANTFTSIAYFFENLTIEELLEFAEEYAEVMSGDEQ